MLKWKLFWAVFTKMMTKWLKFNKYVVCRHEFIFSPSFPPVSETTNIRSSSLPPKPHRNWFPFKLNCWKIRFFILARMQHPSGAIHTNSVQSHKKHQQSTFAVEEPEEKLNFSMSMKSFLLLGLPDASASGSKITNFAWDAFNPRKSGKKFPNQPFVVQGPYTREWWA